MIRIKALEYDPITGATYIKQLPQVWQTFRAPPPGFVYILNSRISLVLADELCAQLPFPSSLLPDLHLAYWSLPGHDNNEPFIGLLQCATTVCILI